MINLTGFTGMTLSFLYMEGGQAASDNAQVWYYDGAVWALLGDMPKTVLCTGQGTWTNYSIALPASANNNANARIGFRWVNNNDGSGADPSIAVDNVQITIPFAPPGTGLIVNEMSNGPSGAKEYVELVVGPACTTVDIRGTHLSQTIAPLLRFSVAGSYAELQFENQTEQLALAHLRADASEVQRLRVNTSENLALLPTEIPEVRAHLATLTATRSDAFWAKLSFTRIMELQETFAPLMRFRNRRPPGTMVRLSLPDAIQRRHWILFGPSGEGAFAETYRAQVEALVKGLAGDNPALRRLKKGQELTPDDYAALAVAL